MVTWSALVWDAIAKLGNLNLHIKALFSREKQNAFCVFYLRVRTPEFKSVHCFIAWYRPPSEPNSCFDNLHENLSFLDGEGKEIIILGDTNCDFCHRDTTPSNIVQLRELYELFDMKQIIKEPTRVTLDSSTLIDHIATTNCNNITESGVLKICLSDHYLVYCVRKLRGGVKHQHKYITSRQLKNFKGNRHRYIS